MAFAVSPGIALVLGLGIGFVIGFGWGARFTRAERADPGPPDRLDPRLAELRKRTASGVCPWCSAAPGAACEHRGRVTFDEKS
jgi:hypothetical protein